MEYQHYTVYAKANDRHYDLIYDFAILTMVM